jgi:NADPH:quinone reductase-like Zn-dependent oxidoreductase
MKAAYIEAFGGPEKVVIGDLPEPSPGAGEIRISMRAAGIGPWDVKAMKGMFPNTPLPYLVGFEFAGIVDQVGEGVTDFAAGDEVYGTDWKAGSFAEYRVTASNMAARKPQKLTFEEAVALAVAGTTALEGLVERLAVGPGDNVLVTAASGGVGTVAVQVAHDAGATVVAVCSTENFEYVRALGADSAFDYHDDGWPEAVRQTYPDGVDKLFDCAGGRTLEQAFAAVKDGGSAVGIVYGPLDQGPRGISFERFSAGSGPARLETVAKMADEGRLRVELAAELPLEQAREALERVEGGHTRGKVVLKLY